MSIVYIVIYDIKNIIKSPLTYISLFLILFLTFSFVTSLNSGTSTVNGSQILRLSAWTFSFVGMLFMTKTLTRDFSQGTIQKYLNIKKNRIRYFISKCSSIIILYFFFGLLTFIFTYISKIYIHATDIDIQDYMNFFLILFIYFVVFSLFSFLLVLLTNRVSLVFSLNIFIILIVPMLLNFIPLIPKYGNKIMHFADKCPITFLPMKLYQGDFKINTEQIIISLIIVVILLIIDTYYIIKKNV